MDAYNKTIESSDVNGQNRRLVMFEALLGLIRGRGEYLFRHKGAGSNGSIYPPFVQRPLTFRVFRAKITPFSRSLTPLNTSRDPQWWP